jgi:hypothetical protein
MAARPAELTESSDLLDDPQALRARLAEDGYVFLRSFLDRSTVLDVRARVLGALAGEGWLAEGSDPAAALPGTPIRREADEHWWDGYSAIQRLEPFHRLAHDPALVGLTGRLLDVDEVLVHPRKIGRVTYPASGMPTPPHQDFPFIQGTVDVLTAWVPFGDYAVDFGPLRILQGSHRDGYLAHGPTFGVGGLGVTADDDDPRWRSTDYRAGDALLFFGFTVHRAAPNEGDSLRLSADYRYQSAHEDVIDGSLHPHMHPAIPGWDDLTQGWSTLDWISTPADLRLVDPRVPDAGLAAGPSRFA